MRRGVGILGVAGRMGRHLVAEARAAGVTVVGGFDRPGSERVDGLARFESAATLAVASDVLIDFTHPSATCAHAAAVVAAKCGWVLGTTGLDPILQEAVANAGRHVAVIQASNFSPGVNLLLRAARDLASVLPAETYDVEIVEMHHRQKVDAPSGTSLALGQAVADGRGVALEQVRDSGRDGQTGARRTGAIGFAALRGGQVVGDHSVIFAAAHEHIILSHRAFDRAAFAVGAIRAAIWAVDRPPGLYGMDDVMAALVP